MGGNRMKRTNSKKNKIKTAGIAAVLLVLMFVGIQGTLAYLTSRQSLTNTFTVGDLEIGLQEPDWNPEEGDGVNVYPGYSVYKNPTVKNITPAKNGEEPCYARMRILLADGSGTPVTDAGRLSLMKTMIRYDSTYTGSYEQAGTAKKLVQGRIPGYFLAELETLPMINPLFEIDKDRSTDDEIVCNYMGDDGKGILKIGEQAVLFTALALPAEWKNEQIRTLGDFQIIVKAEAIQASGFAGQKEALAALDMELQAEGNSAADSK